MQSDCIGPFRVGTHLWNVIPSSTSHGVVNLLSMVKCEVVVLPYLANCTPLATLGVTCGWVGEVQANEALLDAPLTTVPNDVRNSFHLLVSCLFLPFPFLSHLVKNLLS